MKSSKPWLYAAARAFDAAATHASRRRKRSRPPDPRRILVSNIGHLGDALLTLGVPRVLRRAIPGADIDVLVSSAGARLFAGHADVARVFSFDSRLLAGRGSPAHRVVAELSEREYDMAIELRSYVPNSIPLLARSGARFVCGFGSAGFSFLLDRVVPHVDGEHEIRRFARVVEELTGRPLPDTLFAPDLGHLFENGGNGNGHGSAYTVLHPGTRRRRKRWDADGWRKLAERLTADGMDVIVTGAAAERNWLEATFRTIPARILAGSLDVPALARLYGGSRAFIGVDSFPAHLAAAAGAPHVVVLWHDYADPAEWAPVGHGRVSVLPGTASHEAVLRLIAEPD